jgi:ppGpp synthetase/RelA/SpoT-type nucleotidyltranferase
MADALKSLRSSLIERSVKFEAAAEILAAHLRHVLRRSKLVDPQVVPTRVSSRAKTLKSTLRKIGQIRKRKTKGKRVELKTPHNVETHINDLAAARLVCDYLSDIAFIHGYLQRHPAFKILHSKTEDYIAHPKEGYRGVHLVVEMQTSFGRARCEVQLRTMLQHAWAEKSHDLLYKLRKTELERVPKQIRTLMIHQSNLLHDMDTMALEVADAVRQSQRT